VVGFVAVALGLLAFVDHYDAAMQTLAIIFVCAFICVLFGVPIGIAMSRSDRLQRAVTPVLDMLQTLPPFVYLIPLIFLFSVTEPKLYGIAIILYAIVPVVRLTDLGIRLVDKEVIEAATAFGATRRQTLFGVQIPLALPNIMAGEFIVPELLQDAATPDALARAVLDLLADTERRDRLVERFTGMHHALRRDTVGLAADAILAEANR